MELFFIEIFRMGPGMGRLFMGPRFFIPLIFFAAIIAVILISRNKINNPFNNSGNKELDIYNEKHESAVDIIKKRYAKGEITKNEFNQMMKDLN